MVIESGSEMSAAGDTVAVKLTVSLQPLTVVATIVYTCVLTGLITGAPERLSLRYLDGYQ
jgi:hypothetical protein